MNDPSPPESRRPGCKSGAHEHDYINDDEPSLAPGVSIVQCSRAEPLYTAKEESLIRLGLNEAAQGNEIDNSAAALFRSLRKRQVSAEQVIEHCGLPTWETRELSAARGRVMTFGRRYRGKTIGEIPPDYLRWTLSCDNLPFNLRRAIKLVLEA